MTTVLEMPSVSECTVDGCAYNEHHNCHAGAITIGGQKEHAHCDTFIDIGSGGLESMIAHVGACKRADCVHNENLECGASAIRVGPGSDAADCLTYSPA